MPGNGSREAVFVLDTNHLTELGYERPMGARLSARLQKSAMAAVTTIVSVEEQLRGWLARIAKITIPTVRSRTPDLRPRIHELGANRCRHRHPTFPIQP